jgi:hypothetical protein
MPLRTIDQAALVKSTDKSGNSRNMRAKGLELERKMRSLIVYLLLMLYSLPALSEEEVIQADPGLQSLAAEFFEWRRVQQPATGDDIPRVERPDGWVPDYSPEKLLEYRAQYAVFLERLERLDTSAFSPGDQVDAKILRAAIERVHWELDILKDPYRNPLFYVQQTLGSVFELLILSSPMTDSRAENILLRLEHFPATIKSAKSNLGLAVRPFAQATIATLAGIDQRLLDVEAALNEIFPDGKATRLRNATGNAITMLEHYSAWLEINLGGMAEKFSPGPNAYQWFLSHVALLPYTADELLAQGRQAWNRAVAWDAVVQTRNRDLPEMPIFKTAQRQVEASFLKEQEIRAFLESADLMSVPDWLMHYRNRPMPGHLAPLSFMGVTDDLTSETRLDEDAVSYIRDPAPDLPYFSLSTAKDPRPIIIHEGIPGHYFQLALSWANPDPIRRRYIDSGANEGIGFYVEELLLQAGLFDYSPRTKEIIYSFMRLRALRVEVDIRLATGDFTIEEAADYLARTVPMDQQTALDEAVFFAFNPGQAITYQIGKLQILKFLSDAKLDQGDDFSLRHFHDYLMANGNVPIALLRWEYLGRDDEIQRLDALKGEPVTVPQ